LGINDAVGKLQLMVDTGGQLDTISAKEHVQIAFPDSVESLKSELHHLNDELNHRKYNNAYLKQLLILKDKKIQLFKEELEKARTTAPTFNDQHYKHIYTLVDKLHEAEEHLAILKNQITDLTHESAVKDKQIEATNLLHTQIEYGHKKINQVTKPRFPLSDQYTQ
jgi:predicted  nucleic acid-binding Zn-ribbon protein